VERAAVLLTGSVALALGESLKLSLGGWPDPSTEVNRPANMHVGPRRSIDLRIQERDQVFVESFRVDRDPSTAELMAAAETDLPHHRLSALLRDPELVCVDQGVAVHDPYQLGALDAQML
jgi:hypothetical protein